MFKNRILVVFERYSEIPKELEFPNVVFLKFEEVKSDPKILGEFKCILDCTNSFKIYEAIKGKSIEYNNSVVPYIETKSGSIIIVQGITFSRLTASNFSPENLEIKKKEIQDVLLYKNLLKFLTNKIPELSNLQKFEEGLSNEGIILNNYIKNKKKVFLLVKEIPDKKESNVEYITLEGLEVLNKLENIMKKETIDDV